MDEIAMLTYPRLLRRVQAVLIDSLLLPIACLLSIYIVGAIGLESMAIKATALVLPVFILEPGLVSVTGGTVGHHLLKLRVRSARTDKNLNIFVAILRFILKVIFGWFSLVFVLITRRHQAIHDKVSGSIVVNRSVEFLPPGEALPERAPEPGYRYPSGIRRFIVVCLYQIMLFIIVTFLAMLALSEECLFYEQCSSLDETLNLALSLIWALLAAALLVLGWRGSLFGCRKKAMHKPHDQLNR